MKIVVFRNERFGYEDATSSWHPWVLNYRGHVWVSYHFISLGLPSEEVPPNLQAFLQSDRFYPSYPVDYLPAEIQRIEDPACYREAVNAYREEHPLIEVDGVIHRGQLTVGTSLFPAFEWEDGPVQAKIDVRGAVHLADGKVVAIRPGGGFNKLVHFHECRGEFIPIEISGSYGNPFHARTPTRAPIDATVTAASYKEVIDAIIAEIDDRAATSSHFNSAKQAIK